jgi:glyceraldehyde-3-phosphate dehydrogenase/erythrose-4-phosphate dehydrogenase
LINRIGINGFGHMGRLALRAALDRPAGANLGFARINEIACDAASSAHLLQFDSVQAAAPGLLRRGRDGTGRTAARRESGPRCSP